MDHIKVFTKKWKEKKTKKKKTKKKKTECDTKNKYEQPGYRNGIWH